MKPMKLSEHFLLMDGLTVTPNVVPSRQIMTSFHVVPLHGMVFFYAAASRVLNVLSVSALNLYNDEQN